MHFPLEFGRPWALWLLVFLVPLLYLAWTTRAPLRRGRWWLATVLRVLLLLLVVGALADVRWSRTTDRIAVFFLVDGSKSTGSRAVEKASELIERELRQVEDSGSPWRAADEQFGIIVFGQRPLLRRAMGPKGVVALEPPDPETAMFTNIGRAMRYAVTQFPSGCQKRIVLLSDGNENLGDAVEDARFAAANDVDILAVPLAETRDAEVLVDRVIAPVRSRPHQPLDIRASIRSSLATEVAVKVFRDHDLIAEGTVPVEPGANVIRLAGDAIAEPGFHRYEVLVSAPAGTDTIEANNTGLAYTQVYGQARVLYLEGFPEHARRLAAALRTDAARPRGGFALEVGGEARMPLSLEEMARYDCIILSDIPASAMSPGQMTALKQYVEHLGGGLVMIGGEKSLTTGGYLGTPVEEALPVGLDLRREQHLASLAQVIVVDKSGSMGMPAVGGAGTKMDLANQACVKTLELLQSFDRAAVCVVDHLPKWVGGKLRPMTDANKSRLAHEVTTVRAGGGGILVKTGLDTAYEELRRSDAQMRHIILFADAADSEQQNGCFDMAETNRRRHRITLTAVGLGTPGDPDVAFLKTLSETHGGGRFYLTNDARRLPEIFTKETYVVSRNALVEVEEGFRPVRTSGAEAIANIDWAQAPRLYGYVATMPNKPRSEILLTAKDDEPLLARWRFGLGKAAVFTSDAKDRWARDWAAWGDFDRFWSQIVRWTMRETARGSVRAQVVAEGNRQRVIVDAVDADGEYVNGLALSANVVSSDPSVEPERITLRQAGPGRYEGTFDARVTGVAYQVVVIDDDRRAVVDSVGAVLSYPPEYRDAEPDTALLSRVAEVSGGRYLPVLSGSFLRKAKATTALESIWTMLLATCVGLLVLDVAARRLVMPDWMTRRSEDTRKKLLAGAEEVAARLRRQREELWLMRDRPEGAAADEAQAPAASLAESLLAGRRAERAAAPPAFETEIPSAEEVPRPAEAQRPAETEREDEADKHLSATERLLRAKRRARQERTDDTGNS